MIIQFENMRDRQALRGVNAPPAAYDAVHSVDSLPLPRGSISSGPALEFSDLPNPHVHKSTVIVDALCGALTGLGLVVAGFLMLFVRVG